MFLLDEMKHRDERNVGGEEGGGPEAKQLLDGDVEDQLLRIVCCEFGLPVSMASFSIPTPVPLFLCFFP